MEPKTIVTISSAHYPKNETPLRSPKAPRNIYKRSRDDEASCSSRVQPDLGRRWKRGLGIATITLLAITVPFNVAVLGSLTFLWHGGEHNALWYIIVEHNWATRAVTVLVLILCTFAEMQAGAATGMVASLLLESSSISMQDAARWSMARASKPRPRTLLFPVFRGAGTTANTTLVVSRAAIVLLCITITLLQFGTTILFTDFSIGPLRGLSHSVSTRFNVVYPVDNFNYVDPSGWSVYVLDEEYYPLPQRVPTWQSNPPSYPTFAEYSHSEPWRENLDDTGMLLRALLPFSDATDRQTLMNYSGKALVLDSRVSCQAPVLLDLTAQETPGAFNSDRNTSYTIAEDLFMPIQINGTIAPSHRNATRLWTPQRAIPFSCVVAVGGNSTSICQISIPESIETLVSSQFGARLWNRAGGLLSEFSNLTSAEELRHLDNATFNDGSGPGLQAFITWGTPLLVLDTIESGPFKYHRDPYENAIVEDKSKIPTIILHPTSVIHPEGPWSLITENVAYHPWNVRASLCYTAWDTAALNVNVYGNANRTEPVVHWDSKLRLHTEPSINAQLLNHRNTLEQPDLPLSSSGLLKLEEKDSWIPLPEDAGVITIPFVQAYADVSGTNLDRGGIMTGNWTTLRTDVNPSYLPIASNLQTVLADPTLVSLFRNFMNNSDGSVAQSLSAMITILSSMAYYDVLPFFQAETNTTQAFIENAVYPQRTGGFCAAVFIISLHTAVTLAVTGAFLSYSRVSFLGSYWHAAVQLFSEETKDVFASSSARTDREVKRDLIPGWKGLGELDLRWKIIKWALPC